MTVIMFTLIPKKDICLFVFINDCYRVHINPHCELYTFVLFNTFVYYMLWIGGALFMGLKWVVGYNTENVTLDYRW